MRNAYKSLIRKIDWKTPFERSSCRWKDDIINNNTVGDPFMSTINRTTDLHNVKFIRYNFEVSRHHHACIC
jgi:hypothetical protein